MLKKIQTQFIASWFLLSIIILFIGCKPDLPIVPPLGENGTGISHPGKFVWYDLMTDDMPAVKNFYGQLFGWTFLDVGSDFDYSVIMHNGRSIGGIFLLKNIKADVNYSQWISYMSVTDIKTAIEYIKNNGGTIYREPFELPNRGLVAFVFDPQGAVLGLVESQTGDPDDAEPVYSEWLWTELWTDNVENSISFYNGLVGYEQRQFKTDLDNDYFVLSNENKPRAGVIKIPFENLKPNWLPYIALSEVESTVSKIETLGGKIYLDREGIEGKNAAIISDPSGAVFTVQKWPLDKGTLQEVSK